MFSKSNMMKPGSICKNGLPVINDENTSRGKLITKKERVKHARGNENWN